MRAPFAGGVVWLGALGSAAAGMGRLTLVEAMLLLAVLVVVPAAVPLHPAGSRRKAAAAVAVGLPVTPGLLTDQGAVAAVLVLPWVMAAAAGALIAAWWWWSAGRRARDLIWPAAATYLVVGAMWLLADRLDAEPAGFAAPFVQLTAIHFHYAGFLSSVVAGCAWRWHPALRTAATAATCTVTAPPVIAIGFLHVGWLQIVGAAVMTLGLWLLAWVTLRHVVPQVDRLAGTLLAISSLAVLIPMALAVQWAVGANLGTPALSIPLMVRTHGVANAVGFALLAVLGWRLAHHNTAKPPHDS